MTFHDGRSFFNYHVFLGYNKGIMNTYKIPLIVIGLVFILIYSGFYFIHHETFNSPDETANNFFIQVFSENGALAVPASFEGEQGDIVVPRSIRVVNGQMVPASFLGLIILYGAVTALFGNSFLYLFGGLIAVFGVLGYYILIREIWGSRIAFYSALCLFFFPGWWYYASLSFYPNVLLLTLVLWSFVIFIIALRSQKTLYSFLSGILIGFALITRLVAFPWIAFLWILFLIHYSKKKLFSARMIVTWLITILFFMSLLLFIQSELYANPFETGYVLSETTYDKTAIFTNLYSRVIQPGWNPRIAVSVFFNYIAGLFWFIMIPAIFGVAFFLVPKRKRAIKHYYYIAATAGVALWLINYYGSWIVTDNITPGAVTLGVSYVRYFLPIYLLLIPLAVYGTYKFVILLFSRPLLRRFAFVFLLTFYILVTFRLTYFDKNDSLANVHETLLLNELKKEEVLEKTEENAIIVTYRQDKLFFPDRAVIHTLDDEYVFEKLSGIIEERPLYLYTFLDEADVKILKERIQLYNLGLERVTDVYDNTLYQFIIIPYVS